MTERYEVVISGISGRFPECNDVTTYKKMLYNKEDPITFDNRRWPTTYKYKFGEPVPNGTGKYTDIHRFDARVFAVNKILAECTDVINRKVLEPSFEAVLDAGINPMSLMGANVGCYMTCGVNETESIKCFSPGSEKMYLVGSSKAMESNRVSFALNLTGPSFTFYSCVLGGLEALSAAYHSIAEGRVDAAIVGGSSSIIDPKLSVSYMKMGYLSPDSRCRALSKDAEGYGRSEAAVCLYLQRAQDAKRNYATILLSESMYFGSNPYTFIGYGEDVIENTLQKMYSLQQNVKPADISYLEMDACGVPKLEKIECNVVANIFCKERNTPLLIGSVKSQVGHTESTAGFMSIVKALLALDTGYIAPNMHFSAPNPILKPLMENKLKVVAEKTKLPGSIVAVNSYGISGLVGHAVFKQNPRMKINDENDKLPRLILLCGRGESYLKQVVEKVEKAPLDTNMVALTNDIFKIPMPSHTYRAYSVLPAGSKPTNAVEVVGGENRPIWFLFSGMGSQWNGMGKGLLDIPIFANAIERCDRVLKPEGVDIYNILTSDDPALFDDIVNAFVGIIAVQVALVEVLKAIDIKPDFIIGHSLGENSCAYADGCLTLEQSVLASYARGVASKEVKTIKGMMAAVGKGYQEIKDSLPEGIEVACHNSKDNCTLTGPADLVSKFVEELQEQNVFAKTVNVANIAYHSKHIAPAGPGLLKRLKEVIPEPKERSSKWISTSVPEEDWDKPLAKYSSAEYLTNNLLNAVLFEEGSKHIHDDAIVIEIAPHGLLQAILKRSFKSSVSNVPLTLRSQNPNAVNFLLSAIGKLFIAGCQPDVNALYPEVEYPVPRETPNIGYLATWEHMDDWGAVQPLPDEPLSQELIKIRLNKGSEWRYLRGHKVKGQNIIPPSVYMYLTWHMLSVLRNEKLGASNVLFEDIKIHKNLYITLDKHRALTIMIQTGSGTFEVLLESEKDPENFKVVMTGIIQIPFENLKLTINEELMERMKVKITQEEFYKNLENIGYQLKDEFVNVKELSFNETECFGKISWNGNWVTFIDSMMKLHMYSESNTRKETLFPYRLRRLLISTSVFNSLSPGEEVIFHKDLVTKQMWCNGMELMDFVCAPMRLDFPGLDEVHNKLEQMQFIPHAKPGLKNIREFLNLSLQIIVERLSANFQDSNINLSIIDTTGSMTAIIKKIFKTFDYKPKIVYQTFKDIAEKPSLDNFYFLIASSFENADKLIDQTENKLNNVFLLILQPLNESFSWKNKNLFVKVTSETFGDAGVHLYKKVVEPFEHPIPIIVADNAWMTKCAPELKNKKHEPVVVLRNTIETIDLSFILSKRKQFADTRFLYILDDDAPKFAIDNPIYQDQIIQDLPISIFKGGQWGSYRNLNSEIEDGEPEDFDLLNAQDLHLQSVDIMYLNYDYQKIFTDEDSEEYEYGLEYAGISNSGKRVMGLAHYNPLELPQKPDPLLTWDVPKSWSLEEATTVPLLYAQAYYSITLTPLRKGDSDTVFVNSTLAFTEACIAVCLHRNFNIYVTVANDEETEILKRKFPKMNEKNILLRENYKYDVQLKLLTKGDGVSIVINCINGLEHMNACMECISIFGQYIEIIDNQYPEDSKLGLYKFLKSIAFNVLPNKITSILQLPFETKKILHDYLEEGMQSGVIQPLSRTVINNDVSTEYFRSNSLGGKKKIYKCTSRDDTENGKSKMKLKFDDTRSYLIISGGKKNNLWFELLEWLISRGAKKFIVALDNFSLGTKISHQINRLLVQKKTTIILTSLKKTESVQEASNLIREANNIAPLEAVFFVTLDPAEAIVNNMDMASRSAHPFHFICLSSGGLKECELRRRIGLPSALIHSEKPIHELTTLLPRIESILTRTTNITSPTLYDLVDKSNKKGRDSVSLRLSNYLPNDFEGLEDIGYHATDTLQFIEVATLSKPYTETKGTFPLFIIPGTDANQLKPLLKNIHYPAFCTTFTEQCDSLASIASKLCENILQIQPDGPVTVIGETWSGPIAIEVGSLLQNSERFVEVFLIEGSPATWQKHLKSMGEINSYFENNFLKQVLDFDPMINVGSENQALHQTWEELLDKYTSISKFSDEKKSSIVKTLNGIRNRLLMTAKYSPQGEILRHITLFKQRPSESSLDTYCLSDEIHLLEEEKYKEFIKMKEMSNIINQSALFNWWK